MEEESRDPQFQGNLFCRYNSDKSNHNASNYIHWQYYIFENVLKASPSKSRLLCHKFVLTVFVTDYNKNYV